MVGSPRQDHGMWGWELEEPCEPRALTVVLPQDRRNLPAHVWLQTRAVAHG